MNDPKRHYLYFFLTYIFGLACTTAGAVLFWKHEPLGILLLLPGLAALVISFMIVSYYYTAHQRHFDFFLSAASAPVLLVVGFLFVWSGGPADDVLAGGFCLSAGLVVLVYVLKKLLYQ